MYPLSINIAIPECVYEPGRQDMYRYVQVSLYSDLSADQGRLLLANLGQVGGYDWDSDTSVVHEYTRQINDHIRAHNVPERLKERAAQEAMDSWETKQERRRAQLARFQNADGYLKNTDAFLDDYQEALNSRNSPLPFTVGSVANGNLSTVEGEGRGFGVEIEFDGGDAEAISAAMKQAGLSDGNTYYYGQNRDYSRWKMTEDSSVTGGEIVSRVLYDTPESWSELEQVCKIAKEHGAEVSMSTGGHVHIGSTGSHARKGVIAAVAAHQDVIRRLSTNPEAGVHRSFDGDHYTRPFSNDQMNTLYATRGDIDPYDFRRTMMVNIENANTIEFRDADGTLDAGHIQAQVMLSAALVAAAERGQWDDLNSENWSSQRVGGGRAREQYVKEAFSSDQSSERTLASNVSLMTTLDALFPDRESKKRMLNLAARVRWQGED